MFFEILKNLLFNKTSDVSSFNQEDLQEFSPFIVNRWLSFYDRSRAIITNEILNKYSSVFDNKEDQYRFYYNIIPKLSFKKINYIKKVKTKKEELNDISLLAKNKNISEREIKNYIDFLKS